MTQTQKILGTSIFTLLLVIVGLFMVCSGRVQQVQTEDDLFGEKNATTDEAYKDDLLKRLEILENQEDLANGSGGGEGKNSTANDAVSAALTGVENNSAETNQQVEAAESFMTPQLFESMNVEVRQLEKALAEKQRTLDSLRSEADETNYQEAALETTLKSKELNAKPLPDGARSSEIFNSEYGLSYHDALDDFYVRRYESAINKFRVLLQRNDKHVLADNSQYWIGECYFALGNYYQAIVEFQKVYVFENSNKMNDAQLMVGIAFMKAGEKDLARAELNALLSFDKQSTAAKKAQRYLRMLEKA